MILNLSLSFLITLGFFTQSINAQACAPNYCGPNGESCILISGVPTCYCRTGYVGSRCQLNDPCAVALNPCNRNGACYPVVNSVIVSGASVEQVTKLCQCYSGFSGLTCQIVAPKPCDSNPCYNGGLCTNRNNSVDFYCTCVGPYTGATCGTYLDYCAVNRCENGGICVPDSVNKTYICQCTSGFFGQYCEQENDECKSAPCKNNGTCYDLIQAFYCDCVGPYGGVTCETYINPCTSNPCGAGANCVANGGSFTCSCAAGFFGNPCQPDPCSSSPCKQSGSKCVPVEAGALISINPSIPGGVCTNPSATFVCICPGSAPEFASVVC